MYMYTHTNFGLISEERASPHSLQSEVEEVVNVCGMVCSFVTYELQKCSDTQPYCKTFNGEYSSTGSEEQTTIYLQGD